MKKVHNLERKQTGGKGKFYNAYGVYLKKNVKMITLT